MNQRNLSTVVLASVVMTSLTACGAGGSGPSAESDGTGVAAKGIEMEDESGGTIEPIARIDFENGSTVAFFEREPGMLEGMQWGPNLVVPPVDRELAARRLSAPELYTELTGYAPPAELVAAQGRLTAASAGSSSAYLSERPSVPAKESAPAVARDPLASSVASDGIGESRQAVRYYDCQGPNTYEGVNFDTYDEWFNCKYCANGRVDFDYTWLSRTGSGTFARDGVQTMFTTVSVYGGAHPIHFKIRKDPFGPFYGWSTVSDVTVAVGFYFTKFMGITSADYDVRATVDQADGNSYHWCSHGFD